VAPEDVDIVVNSHLHFDHVGGNADLPNAKLIVQRREWEAAADPELVRRNGYNRADFDLGHQLRLIDGEYDLFGDGRIVCIPTYGHTAGHQSLRVRLDGGEVVLTADSCYMRKVLEEMVLPPFAHDFDAMRQVIERFRAIERAGATAVPVRPYRYAPAADADSVAGLIGKMAAGGIDLLVITSSPQVDRLFEVAQQRQIEPLLREALERTKVAVIGPVAAETLRERQVRVDVCPEQGFVMKNLVQHLTRASSAAGAEA